VIILYILLLILLAIFSTGFIIFLIMQFLAVFTTDAPFVPVPEKIEDDIIKSLELKPDSILYDLGCGDARILLKAVQKHPDIKAVGVEIAYVPYLLAKFYTRNYNNIQIKREDIFKTDISNATHIFNYFSPAISRLNKNIETYCKSGTRIVTCDFEIKKIKPTQIIELNQSLSPRGKKLFVYTI